MHTQAHAHAHTQLAPIIDIDYSQIVTIKSGDATVVHTTETFTIGATRALNHGGDASVTVVKTE